MRRLPSILAAVVLLLSATAVEAARVERVDIVGLDEPMTENVEVSLSVINSVGKEVSGRRLAYLIREVDDQTREALEPFGYYSPTIDVQRSNENGGVVVRVVVDAGQPVRVRNRDIAILGEGGQDRYLARDLAGFVPDEGSVFNHAEYDGSRNRITRRLAERGYFDTEFTSRRVEVTRADFAADIDLVWNSGDRFNMGATTFEQTPEQVVNDSLLERLIYWDEGSYYHQGRLDRLRTSLTRLDYFANIDISPQVDEANANREVPIQVTLTPAKRSIYTSGVSYGTDSGAGIRLGVERRYVNMRGHKALAQLDYAQKRKTLTVQYRIPAFAWLDGWYTASLQAADEQTDYIDSRRIEFVASRSGQYNPFLNLVASMHVLRERWLFRVADDGEGALAAQPYRYATFAYPSVRAEYVDVDDRIFPRAGIGGSLMLRGGVEGVGSDASFGQIHARASWFRGIGESNRLIVRGEIGHTFTDELTDMPPSLRFYAGGDRSIRGYEYREVSPRIDTDFGRYSVGAQNLVTASVEFERYFTDTIGAAVFVDSGDAFDGTSPDWRTGVGIGARYRSPVGPLKLDIARGLDNPDSGFTIGLTIGAEF
ncbi:MULTISPECIES: autotransporter assembly complex protein TamA [Luteimonas]|uniref:autotransporter assembly complex protein TamA n=1 Tax=Luteimonas TaxID=83614 RepID=UPI000C7BE12C|nr:MULTISPECIES: autotransporter assembly complex family protein [Luteimonas]